MASHLDLDTRSAATAIPSPRVPLLDLSRENGPLNMEIERAISEIIQSGQFVLGPECVQLEQEVAQLCGVSHAIGCASGSDALLLALSAFDIGPGDEVIVPSFTFFATASAVWRLGARPVFVDIDPTTFCIAPSSIKAAVTPRTRAVIPVHLFGQCADMPVIQEIAQQHELRVIEDAAQAIGAELEGRPAGSWGDIGCFSFYPTKNLGAFGDGGMLTTSSDELADSLKLLRVHGMHPRYYHQRVGINSRLDSIQAAVLRIKLGHLRDWSAQRRDNADRYRQMFDRYALAEHLMVPQPGHGSHVWNQFTIRVLHGRRNELREHLTDAGIGTEIYYPVPLHQQDCFRELGYGPGSLPETERVSAEVLSLPIFPGLTAGEQKTVVGRIAEFFDRAA